MRRRSRGGRHPGARRQRRSLERGTSSRTVAPQAGVKVAFSEGPAAGTNRTTRSRLPSRRGSPGGCPSSPGYARRAWPIGAAPARNVPGPFERPRTCSRRRVSGPNALAPKPGRGGEAEVGVVAMEAVERRPGGSRRRSTPRAAACVVCRRTEDGIRCPRRASSSRIKHTVRRSCLAAGSVPRRMSPVRSSGLSEPAAESDVAEAAVCLSRLSEKDPSPTTVR